MPTEEQKTVDIDTSGPGAEINIEEKKDEDKLEDYSKGVQARIAKLTRKMREAERREKAALDYAKAVESKRKTLDSRFGQVNKDYVTQFEKRVKDGMESAQKELSSAIESGDATAQVNAQKRIAALSIDEARLNVMKDTKPAEERQVKLEELLIFQGKLHRNYLTLTLERKSGLQRILGLDKIDQ